ASRRCPLQGGGGRVRAQPRARSEVRRLNRTNTAAAHPEAADSATGTRGRFPRRDNPARSQARAAAEMTATPRAGARVTRTIGSEGSNVKLRPPPATSRIARIRAGISNSPSRPELANGAWTDPSGRTGTGP